MPAPRKSFRSPARVERAQAIREGRAIKPLPILTMDTLKEGRLPYARFFGNARGNLFGLQIRPYDHPSERKMSLYQLNAPGGKPVLVARAGVRYTRRKAELFDIGKGVYAREAFWGGEVSRGKIRPRGLNVMTAFLGEVVAESKRRGIRRIVLETENEKLAEYYAQFGFRRVKGLRKIFFPIAIPMEMVLD